MGRRASTTCAGGGHGVRPSGGGEGGRGWRRTWNQAGRVFVVISAILLLLQEPCRADRCRTPVPKLGSTHLPCDLGAVIRRPERLIGNFPISVPYPTVGPAPAAEGPLCPLGHIIFVCGSPQAFEQFHHFIRGQKSPVISLASLARPPAYLSYLV